MLESRPAEPYGERIAAIRPTMPPRSRRSAVLAQAGFLLVWSSALQAAPKQAKIDRFLEQSVRAGGSTQSVIITVSDPALRAQIRKSLEAHGDVVKAEHPSIGALTAAIHTEDVAQLATHPGVRFVSTDATV